MFILKWLVLTIFYMAIFVVFFTAKNWLRKEESGKNFPKSLLRNFIELVSEKSLRPERWRAVVFMTATSFVLACVMKSGDPLLLVALRDLKDWWLTPEGLRNSIHMLPPGDGTWFWWSSFAIYLFATIVYFPVAYADRAISWLGKLLKNLESRPISSSGNNTKNITFLDLVLSQIAAKVLVESLIGLIKKWHKRKG